MTMLPQKRTSEDDSQSPNSKRNVNIENESEELSIVSTARVIRTIYAVNSSIFKIRNKCNRNGIQIKLSKEYCYSSRHVFAQNTALLGIYANRKEITTEDFKESAEEISSSCENQENSEKQVEENILVNNNEQLTPTHKEKAFYTNSHHHERRSTLRSSTITKKPNLIQNTNENKGKRNKSNLKNILNDGENSLDKIQLEKLDPVLLFYHTKLNEYREFFGHQRLKVLEAAIEAKKTLNKKRKKEFYQIPQAMNPDLFSKLPSSQQRYRYLQYTPDMRNNLIENNLFPSNIEVNDNNNNDNNNENNKQKKQIKLWNPLCKSWVPILSNISAQDNAVYCFVPYYGDEKEFADDSHDPVLYPKSLFTSIPEEMGEDEALYETIEKYKNNEEEIKKLTSAGKSIPNSFDLIQKRYQKISNLIKIQKEKQEKMDKMINENEEDEFDNFDEIYNKDNNEDDLKNLLLKIQKNTKNKNQKNNKKNEIEEKKGGKKLDDIFYPQRKYFCRRCFTYQCRRHADLYFHPPNRIHSEKGNFSVNEYLNDCLNRCHKNSDEKNNYLNKLNNKLNDKLNNNNNNNNNNLNNNLNNYDNNYGEDFTVNLNEKKMENKEEKDKKEDGDEWNKVDEMLFIKGCDVFGVDNYCLIADLLPGKSCSSVKKYSEKLKNISIDYTKKFPIKVEKKSEIITDEDYSSHFPCKHEGKCSMSLTEYCECSQRPNNCDKDCSCSLNCFLRYRGCDCKIIDGHCVCKDNKCRCVKEGRECDPDICNCKGGLSDRLKNLNTCQNVGLTFDKHKYIIIGKSKVVGLGAYSGEPIKKGEFIIEYMGELCSQEEGERRGTEYDRREHSFLFDLSKNYVLDATRKGNKTRFLNHSERPNCQTLYKECRGDLRIGLFATRNIEIGEELFFNYHYTEENSKFVSAEQKNAKKKRRRKKYN